MKIVKALFTYLLLPVAIVALVIIIVQSVMVPVNFDKQRTAREAVAIQRLKDIRTLQTAFKSENGRFTANMDSLLNFYRTGKMKIVMRIGSADDSLAVANTEKLRRRHRRITPQEMYRLYLQGEHLVFSVNNEIPVKDTLFNGRENFCIDSLRYVPFSGGELVEMDAVTKLVSGVNVPLFEAKMPFAQILKGLDRQLVINLKAERKDQERYPGLMVGSITAPNNNAGNWE